MRKLILTSIEGKTGDLMWEEERLVVVNHNHEELEEDLLKKAVEQVKLWLTTERPHSEYLAIIPKATIGEPTEEPQRDIEMFGRDGLVSFGQYLLSEERTNRIKANYHNGGISLEERLREVYHADVENWLASIKKG